MAGSIRVTGVNASVPTVVDITTSDGGTELDAFSDVACTQAVSLPATITQDTTFYVTQTGAVLLSVTVEGTELAGPAEVFLSNAGPVTFPLDPDSRNTGIETVFNLVASRLGAPAAATTLGTVVAKIEVFDRAGVSAGFVPVYDAIT